jgi:transcription termination factor NusB
MSELEIKKISVKESKKIQNKIKELISINFKSLNTIDKNLLQNSLYKLVIIFSLYFYNEKFTEQLFLNNYQDIFSLLVLLMPYYSLNESNKIVSFVNGTV